MKSYKHLSLPLLAAAAALIAISVIFILFSEPTPKPDSSIQELTSQSSSDETSAIKKDLLDTDLNSLDREITAIESELP